MLNSERQQTILLQTIVRLMRIWKAIQIITDHHACRCWWVDYLNGLLCNIEPTDLTVLLRNWLVSYRDERTIIILTASNFQCRRSVFVYIFFDWLAIVHSFEFKYILYYGLLSILLGYSCLSWCPNAWQSFVVILSPLSFKFLFLFGWWRPY